MNSVLTVLVAGHQPNRLPVGDAMGRLFDRLAKLLFLLQDTAKARHMMLRLMTGVADGTDEETARIAENLKLPLHLFAPWSGKKLLNSHQQRAERVVWLGASDSGLQCEEATAIRDEVALSFADLLVVVWDGESPQGLSGGTVRLAFRAALMMKPVVWLTTDNEIRMLERTRLDAAYLHKLRCPHPEPTWLRDCFSDPLDEAMLQERLAESFDLILDPSARSTRDDAKRLADWQASADSCKASIRAGHIHEAMMALMHFDIARMFKQFLARLPQAYWGPAKDCQSHLTKPTTLIDTRFEQMDIEAAVASGRHRDSTWVIYGASAMAVFAAVAGAIDLWPGGHHSPFWPVVELMLICMIIGTFALAKKQRWHGKWISFRFIAEQLRYAKVCLPLLGAPRPFMEPAWQINNGQLQLANAGLWFIQRTMTMQGLPCTEDGTPYIASSDEGKARLSEYVRLVVEDQVAYHLRNYNKLHIVHGRLHKLEMGLFGATVIAVLAHFVIPASWLLICTAVFPALAAAVYGLATKLEISRIAGQSAATARDLKDIAVAIDESANQPGWDGWVRLRQLSLDAARIMSDENDQWQQLVRHQEAGLP